ncbi:MAG: nucleoside deaminase [Flavobacteriales bacterium]|nr:nucleoside deaminase [Flavobacteriales bacterium]
MLNGPLRKALVFLLVPGVLVFCWAMVHKAYVFEPSARLAPAQVQDLGALGVAAIGSLDVPVAALLVYRGEVIGRGYNTVLRDGNAGGHAEINAISDAMRMMGTVAFDGLDREDLVLITTFEPCAMCRGAIIEYRIDRVGFVEPKSLRHHAGQWLKALDYEVHKVELEPAGLQDSLFHLHPGYDPANDDH